MVGIKSNTKVIITPALDQMDSLVPSMETVCAKDSRGNKDVPRRKKASNQDFSSCLLFCLIIRAIWLEFIFLSEFFQRLTFRLDFSFKRKVLTCLMRSIKRRTTMRMERKTSSRKPIQNSTGLILEWKKMDCVSKSWTELPSERIKLRVKIEFMLNSI